MIYDIHRESQWEVVEVRERSLQFRLGTLAELGLRDALAHSSCRRDATSDGLHEVVHVIGATPL